MNTTECFTVRSLNTPVCWEVNGPFSVLLVPGAARQLWGEHPHLDVRGNTLVVANGIVKQVPSKANRERLTVFVTQDGRVTKFFLPHSLILGIRHDPDDFFWINSRYCLAPWLLRRRRKKRK